MDCVNREIKTKNSYGNEVKVKATGPLLSEFIDKRGGDVKIEDIDAVSFRAADGYKIDLTTDELKKVKTILTIRYGDKPLSGDAQPLRIVTTGTESSYWVSGVERIDFTLKE
jgi:DMSO/TMAO reductase YedYZ molybdopterin-dependent catalytic subunit